MNDFSVHRIIGRGGFGEVYGCRKVDTGKMYAMKCLDKKRIKLKGGESLAMNERNMLAAVSSGVSKKYSPFFLFKCSMQKNLRTLDDFQVQNFAWKESLLEIFRLLNETCVHFAFYAYYLLYTLKR